MRLLGSRTNTETFPSIFVTQHSLNLQTIGSRFRLPKKFNMTPYRSSFPIDYIPLVDPLDSDIPRQRQIYWSIVGCINWFVTFTHSDITPVITLIDSYRNSPHPQHYKSAVHALKYLTSTHEYNISFHSESFSTIQAFNQFPHQHDREAYTEATSPFPS